ncbi:hypothetical protein DMB92_01500 [Campylobacter sp. MIT 99-7217]|uniref:TonB-dependent receptor n=1 Tax=Campylobacter sp. MIT 99-7217 TaxID=535091 RepID=UPI0011582554|nr:TonB-dependent receptor [Campylobacter sp. MIT 99-7217]TQR34661.1 hypothetical protein DMB92_01500 [Campylobacter sp. MIT 99-7217]
MGYGQAQFSELPQDYATLDIGTRLFHEKFTLGGLIKYTGKSKRIDPTSDQELYDPNYNPTIENFDKILTQDLPNIPTIVDLYMIFDPIKNLSLKFEVQNLFDKNYVDALNTYNSSASNIFSDGSGAGFNNQARGRTFIGSFVFRY